MLLPRIITAFILIPATLAILYYATPLLFLLITAIIVLYGAWEWAGLMQIKTAIGKLAYVILILLAINVAAIYTTEFVLGIAFLWWLAAFILILVYPRLSGWWGQGFLWRGVMGILVLVPFWWALNFIRSGNEGFFALVFVLVVIWGADSAAYFVGRKWGKHKLAPHVSPGKTWEGCIGAAFSTLIIPVIVFVLYKIPLANWPVGILLAFITVFFSIVGDLFESAMKRVAGVKDSGMLLPGHGGLLDRIDSLTAAAPVFGFAVWFLSTYHF